MKGQTSILQLFGAAVLIYLFGFPAHGQEAESISFRTKSDTALNYVSPLEYAFMMHEETRFMLRVPAFGVGAELEILPYFTWMTQVYYPLTGFASRTYIPKINSELRWYYGSRDLGVRNMSGNYLATGGRFEAEYLRDGFNKSFGYYAKWGMQRRILGNGLADIGLIAGISTRQVEGFSRLGFFIESPVSLGFGFVFGERKTLDRNKLCPVLKCHEVESFLLKINFAELISYKSLESPIGPYQFLSLNPNIAIEQKFLASPFSFNLDLRSVFYYSAQTKGSEVNSMSLNTFRLNAGLRWYYNMNRRMHLGKGGNGLSGNYISAGMGSFYSSDEDHFSPIFDFENRIYPFISTGIQRTLGRRVYYDLNIGVRNTRSSYLDYGIAVNNTDLYGNAQIGMKF